MRNLCGQITDLYSEVCKLSMPGLHLLPNIESPEALSPASVTQGGAQQWGPSSPEALAQVIGGYDALGIDSAIASSGGSAGGSVGLQSPIPQLATGEPPADDRGASVTSIAGQPPSGEFHLLPPLENWLEGAILIDSLSLEW
jgi:hypothetical protein